MCHFCLCDVLLFSLLFATQFFFFFMEWRRVLYFYKNFLSPIGWHKLYQHIVTNILTGWKSSEFIVWAMELINMISLVGPSSNANDKGLSSCLIAEFNQTFSFHNLLNHYDSLPICMDYLFSLLSFGLILRKIFTVLQNFDFTLFPFLSFFGC